MTKKLKILGPYTPDHEGPFCTRGGEPVRLITKTDGAKGYPIVGTIDEDTNPDAWDERGRFNSAAKKDGELDLMNAREVPVAREFWINEYRRGDGSTSLSRPHETECEATRERHELPNWDWVRTIHAREVLPGEGE
ncbi:hypothetical protein FKW50_06790 [Acetobacter pomorum]|uniref:hypothetical protein n=1 Tax=Acetobacter pomorum TaxID=65959 RepID=UPI001277A576|nr:hypothetical protein [Acetobacter pomorum]KAA8419976.1 hypothetical protein FKW54_14490 [Acetobacter pomorum]KAA8435522.1 hypothetical protein FKW50_06790 [Acetobacter pomorum]KAA8448345.1 hypothetical protein FKW52_13665 [Acetobacter pomorum]